jgi:hypothetical protein
MHDYNNSARTYWWAIAVIGYALLAHAIYVVAALPSATMVQILLASAFAGAIAIFPVRIPGTTLSIAGGEIFIFLALALFGVEAAVLAAALEGAIASGRTSKRWTSWFGTPAMAAITTSIAGYGFLAVRTALERHQLVSGTTMLALLTIFAIIYCALSNIFPSLLLAFKRNERLDVMALLKDRSWMAVAHVASGAIAGLLFFAGAKVDVWVLLAALPAIALSVFVTRSLLESIGTERALRHKV